MQARQPIRIVGGGIAGLGVACALAQRGARVVLRERAEAIGEVGAGLQISPNGLAVIEALGLGAALRAVALRAEAVALRDHHARAVLRMDLARDYLFVHRARLVEVLAAGARAAGVRIELGAEGPGPGDGLIIGADGLHSALRARINGDGPPFFTGQVAWRALIAGEGPAQAEVFMGPGRHLVSYPLAGGLRNIVAVQERSAWAEEGWHHADDPANLRAAFADFAPRVCDWLGAVRDVHLWGLFRHPVAPRWHADGAVLLGDAAHPTLPFLAQGANMALEDAWVLAACLAAHPQDAALARYQALRRDRVVRVIDAASANARNYHLSNPLVRGLAHAALRVGSRLSRGAALRRFEWLYGHDVTRIQP